MNPYGKVPTLVDDDFVLNESAVIVNYLCDSMKRKLYSKVGQKKEQNMMLCWYLVIEIDAQSLYMHRKHIGLNIFMVKHQLLLMPLKHILRSNFQFIQKCGE